jgi:AcrR family transcriptional regulator
MDSETPRSSPILQKILEAAETLFSEKSIYGTSLREIGVKAGSSNNSVVKYYFETLENLVLAVFEHRIEEMEYKRVAMFTTYDRKPGELDEEDILSILFKPLVEARNSEGKRSYAGFLRHSVIYRRPPFPTWKFPANKAPFTDYLVSLLKKKFPLLPDALYKERLHTVTAVFLDIMHAVDEGNWPFAEEEAFEEAVNLSVALLRAPPNTARD